MFMDYLLVAVPVLPLILAMLMPLMNRSAFILVTAPVLALVSALVIPVNTSVHLPWVLIGVHWQLDGISQTFLMFSALVWLVASLYVIFAHEDKLKRGIYRGLFLLAMAGNMLLIVAADMISFLFIGYMLAHIHKLSCRI